MNRLYSQRYMDPTAGLIQSGAVAAMPLTSRLMLLLYDGDVYRSIGHNSVHRVRKYSDIDRLNELQVIRASETLFFQDESDGDYVASLFDKYCAGRKGEWSITWVGIRDGDDGEFERFRKITDEDQDSLEPRIQSVSPILTRTDDLAIIHSVQVKAEGMDKWLDRRICEGSTFTARARPPAAGIADANSTAP